MSVHRLPDRDVPRMPPWTTLEALEREHKRLKDLAAADMGEKPRNPEEWNAHLAKVLRPEFSQR